MKKVLLHICCGVCSSHAIEKLKSDGYEVTAFFYNPNIEPQEEYLKRLETAKFVCSLLGVLFIDDIYDNDRWIKAVAGLEKEPEGARRCQLCYKLRLEKTWDKANKLGIEFIASTLSISPHKNTDIINQIGKEISQGKFLPYNFKKEEGFKKTNQFAKDNDLYRQNYCGCLFSKR